MQFTCLVRARFECQDQKSSIRSRERRNGEGSRYKRFEATRINLLAVTNNFAFSSSLAKQFYRMTAGQWSCKLCLNSANHWTCRTINCNFVWNLSLVNWLQTMHNQPPSCLIQMVSSSKCLRTQPEPICWSSCVPWQSLCNLLTIIIVASLWWRWFLPWTATYHRYASGVCWHIKHDILINNRYRGRPEKRVRSEVCVTIHHKPRPKYQWLRWIHSHNRFCRSTQSEVEITVICFGINLVFMSIYPKTCPRNSFVTGSRRKQLSKLICVWRLLFQIKWFNHHRKAEKKLKRMQMELKIRRSETSTLNSFQSIFSKKYSNKRKSNQSEDFQSSNYFWKFWIFLLLHRKLAHEYKTFQLHRH